MRLLEILYDRRTEINSEYTGEKIKIDIMKKKKQTDILQVCGYRTKKWWPILLTFNNELIKNVISFKEKLFNDKMEFITSVKLNNKMSKHQAYTDTLKLKPSFINLMFLAFVQLLNIKQRYY